MRKSMVFFVALAVAGCSGPPKAEVTNAEVAGKYRMYVEPALGETDHLSLIIMRSAAFVLLTINEDGTYIANVDNKERPNHGAPVDQGVYRIEGKNIAFDSKKPASPTERTEQCFTALGNTKVEPIGPGKYRFTFKNGDRIVLWKQ